MAYLLANHPEVQDKIRDEMKVHITDYKSIIESEISKLSYCYCVLQEVLRLYTIIPFVNRTTTKNYVIDLVNHEVDVITDSDWFSEKVYECVATVRDSKNV